MPAGGALEVIANWAALAATDVCCEALPPAPVHCNAYETVPAAAGMADWEPLVATAPDQSLSLGVAEAVQEVACVLDQVRVTDCPTVTELGDAEIVTVGLAGGGGTTTALPTTAGIEQTKTADNGYEQRRLFHDTTSCQRFPQHHLLTMVRIRMKAYHWVAFRTEGAETRPPRKWCL